MANIPFLDLQAQYQSIKPEIDAAIHSILDRSAYVQGAEVAAFEKAFAAYCQTSECIGVASGTSAPALLMRAHGIGPGDEVIAPANTFFATVEAIIHTGATPVLVDCDPKTALIDTAAAERACTNKTKAIIAVHLYGQPADTDALIAFAKPRSILVFEDAAQAHGATLRGRRVGSLADGASFSFYPGKNLGAYGEAGAVTTNDPQIARHIRLLREHGQPKKYVHEIVGYNERMDNIQGAVLGVKLPHLDAWNARRRTLANVYRKHLPAAIIPITELPDRQGVYHLFVIEVANRQKILDGLAAAGIGAGIHYPDPVHLLPAMQSYGWKRGQFPVAEAMGDHICTLPMYAEMTEAQVLTVCTTLEQILRA
jgi:dTDP-4-amino-4,6-dideoxygalactose transaminase